jgi:Nucleotidyl transferase AbiEii toxin, Type IV TA system
MKTHETADEKHQGKETPMILKPNLSILSPPQLLLWAEIDTTPEEFTLYGGTALALRFGHRASIDFVFFLQPSS